MKNTAKIIVKLAMLVLFLYVTPFYDDLLNCFENSQDFMHNLIYHQQVVAQDISLKKQLNVWSYNENLTLPKDEIKVETTLEDPMIVPGDNKQEKKENSSDASTDKKQNVPSNGKKIYIYNTHQDEKYQGGKTVMDAAVILAGHLEKKGYKVVLETNDFNAYCNTHGLTYNDLYTVSNKYLNDALVNYGGFDLCIDLHRDSVPRAYSYIKIGNKTYAKAMMVVAGSSSNVKSATKISTTLTDMVNKRKNGIMKHVMTRQEAYYNQYVHKGIVLMECGSDYNTFEEVKNTLGIVAQGIDELMKKGW